MMNDYEQDRQTIIERLLNINWLYLLVVSILVGIGYATLKSAAFGTENLWAEKQMIRFGIGLSIAVIVGVTDIKFWMKYAYFIYAVFLSFLVIVHFSGFIGMGAQRWIRLGPIVFQPSELMKFGVILALARYFHSVSVTDIRKVRFCLVPFFIIAVPAFLIFKQPDLGTTILILLGGVAAFFLVGVQYWKFVLMIVSGVVVVPTILWRLMHDYQRNRILTYLNPERDPLGKGYHILQSKITLGSGGIFGKGYMNGTQSHLNFLPEKHTDFIFTVISEEFGFIGGAVVIALYVILLIMGYVIATRSQNYFGKVLAAGITTYIFIYFFVNIAMVTGLVPVVGAPLPLVSYGGSSLLTMMFSFGLVECVYTNRNVVVSRRGANFDDDY